MADGHLTLAIVDEGYYKKFFAISPTTNLKKLLDAYRSHLCTTCSNPNLLDFWYDTQQIQDGHTARALNMTNGDIIDVRISNPCTRGACPIPPEQTLPNIHYLAAIPRSLHPPAAPAVRESQPVPENSDRITMTIKDQVNASLTLRIKKTTTFRKVLEAYAKQVQRPAGMCRLYLDGLRLGMEETPAGVEMEEGDLVDVFTEQTGGADARSVG